MTRPTDKEFWSQAKRAHRAVRTATGRRWEALTPEERCGYRKVVERAWERAQGAAVVVHHARPHSFQAYCPTHPWFRRAPHVLPRAPKAQVEEHNANYHGAATAAIVDENDMEGAA